MAGIIKIAPYKPLGVSTQAVPGGGYLNVDASVGNFGPSPLAQLGLQAAQGATGIAGVVAEQLAGDNEATVKLADTRMGETEQALLFDSQNGYLNLQGQDALTQAPAVLDTYREAQSREMATLTDDDQRRMFAELADRRLATLSTQVEHHATAERQRWYDTTSERRIALMQADAALHWSDDALLRRALGTARAEARDQAERKGWDAALTETTMRRQTSRVLVSAIEAAVERSPERAQSLRTRYAQHIEENDSAALDALLSEAQTRERAQAASIEILNATPPDGEQPTPQWRLRQAEAIAEPAVRAATIRRLTSVATAEEARARTQAEQALARVLKDGLTDPSQIPVRQWVTLDAERRQAIETRLDHNARGDEPAPNPALVDELATQMTDAPQDFARRDLVPAIAHLPLPQWQRFRERQAGIRRDDPATQDEIYAIRRGLQLARKMLPDDDSATGIRAELVEEIATRRRIDGKSPTDADIAGMLARYVPTAPHTTQTLEWDPRVGTESTQLRFVPPRARPGDRSDIHLAQAELQEPAKARRGVAPLTEPDPGSPEFQDAMAAAKVITNPNPELDPDSKAFETEMAARKARLIADPGKPVVLPNGEKVPSDEPDRPPFLMSPVADLSEVARAGRITGAKLRIKLASRFWEFPGYAEELVGQALAQGGQFDYQRTLNPDGAPGYVQLRQFRDVSNFNVGLFMQQTGFFPRVDEVLWIAGQYAKKHSRNYMEKEPYGLDPRVRRWIERGFAAGESGLFDPPPRDPAPLPDPGPLAVP
ncbi:MAG TPA: hypothetical protein VG942_00300 [Hyphomonadaceae bacterium]|nr:hypothetical protein [Hyphomonadaceae bacterium]